MDACSRTVCLRCNRSGHAAAACTLPFVRECSYCKAVGHSIKSCPKRAANAAKNAAKLDDSQSTSSEVSAADTAASSFDSRRSQHSQYSQRSQPKPAVNRLDPSELSLTEMEEREVRKLEKKLRDIAALERKRDMGAHLDKLQLEKLQKKAELEDCSVIRKLRLGYARVTLEGP
ncbi:unnamed protein product [Effrenium voratum]|nr:unnamed protein product [Effrenium voratum]CAJ1451183.1 unnamed protein product [Effrenium voratum]|eukprot:CAMPEP_0181462696 /NCGR_PEP_ID=MMETSP1110-20121109/34529_1 /TAXON_ID=174948 /ORGANISM="Symbiodinium sp., Strain CCMP421" /LENGTH=173 /DNA_ID=CAMNT_0023587365 /DNA_START=52 /DNA_END=573 /DNA_ORIENTATION=-